jgi:hypothetical protein
VLFGVLSFEGTFRLAWQSRCAGDSLKDFSQSLLWLKGGSPKGKQTHLSFWREATKER